MMDEKECNIKIEIDEQGDKRVDRIDKSFKSLLCIYYTKHIQCLQPNIPTHINNSIKKRAHKTLYTPF